MKLRLRMILPALILLVVGPQLHAADVHFSWVASDQPNVAGYRIYYGTTSRTYSTYIDVGNTTGYAGRNFPPGIYYFAVTSYDTFGLESDFSDELYATLNATSPNQNLLSLAAAPISIPTATTATVSWSTTLPSTALVEYGAAPAYGNQTATDASLVLSHTQILAGLLPGTLYHFIIRSQDATGNLTVSGDMTFTTLPPDSETRRTIIFPRAAIPNGITTGFALTNLDSSKAWLTFRAFDQDGNLLGGTGITNPRTLSLAPRQQLPVLDTDIFGSTLPPAFSGWIEVASTAAKVAGFFLNFNSSLTTMDGTPGCYLPVKSAIFPEIGEQGFTTIAAVNPGSSATDVTIELVQQDGTVLRSTVRNIKPNGVFIANVFTELFLDVQPDASCYLRASATQPVAYSQLFAGHNIDFDSLNGQDTTSTARTLYAPQYAVGGPWTTALSVVNLDSIPDTVFLRLITKDGIEVRRSLPIAANGKIHLADADYFIAPGSGIVEGYLEIKSASARLSGSVVFGDIERIRFSAALPLTSALGESLMLLHIASNPTYYTGLALLNPGSTAANVTLELFDVAGNPETSITETIPPGQRLSKLLTQYFPQLVNVERTSGSLRIRADTSIAAFALFGTRDLASLAAIPVEIVR